DAEDCGQCILVHPAGDACADRTNPIDGAAACSVMDVATPADVVAQGARPSGRHVDVRNVWKAYTPGTYAVRDVTFTLHPGEFLTLLGPSGSGKTSTLMMVAGFETLSEGEIRVDGKDVAKLPPERRNFGVVFQGYALFPHMSVLDNVEFPLRMKRVARQ